MDRDPTYFSKSLGLLYSLLKMGPRLLCGTNEYYKALTLAFAMQLSSDLQVIINRSWIVRWINASFEFNG